MIKETTPSREAKRLGVRSLQEASNISQTSRKTLENWYHNRPALFRTVIIGCVSIKRTNEESKEEHF
jgi:hypothetical protein